MAYKVFKGFSAYAPAFLVLLGLSACASHGGTAKPHYVSSPVTDTLTIELPDSEDEFCKIRIYGNNAVKLASDYVIGGKVKFYVGSLPAGRHRVFIHAGDVVADEAFVKR